MGFLGEMVKLTRFEHAVMLAIAVLIAEVITLGSAPALTIPIMLSLLVPIFSEMGSFSLNDYLDRKTDKLNKKKDRPLVKGTIKPKFAYNFSWACLIISTIFAFFINIYAFAIALVFNLLAIAYNYRLKDLPLAGNVYIGLTMAIPFIFGNYVISEELNMTVLILSALGFIAGLAREIIKSVEDMKGDKKARKSKTLPITIGAKNSLLIASLLYIIFVPLTVLPFIFGLKMEILPVALICIADIGIIFIIWEINKTKKFRKARNISLLCLFIGLIAYLLATLL